MPTPRLTAHVQEQVRKMSEQGIAVTISEILHAINNFGDFPAGVQSRVIVKNFGRKVKWVDKGESRNPALLEEAIDSGLHWGLRRYLKHRETDVISDPEDLVAQMELELWNALDQSFEISDTEGD